MEPTTENTHEENARLWKATRLADWIDANVVAGWLAAGDVTPAECVDALGGMPRLWWKGVAHHAGVNVPSLKTVAVVQKLLGDRLARRGDVFEQLRKSEGRMRDEGEGDGIPSPRFVGCSDG